MTEQGIQVKMRFTGANFSKLDSQRRLIMPKLWRDMALKTQCGSFYVIPAGDRTIKICGEQYYNQYCEYIDSLDDSEPDILQAKTIFGMLTCVVEPDGQGRFALTPEMLAFTNLGQPGDTLALIGATEYGRIMTMDAYNTLFGNSQPMLRNLDQNVNQEKRARIAGKINGL